MSSVGSGLIASLPQELVFEPFILHEKCPRVLHQVSRVKPQRGVPSPQIPVSWVTSPVDLGQLATTFPWDISPVLIRGVSLATGSQVRQGPNRAGDPTIRDGPDWVGNPTIPIFRRWPGVGESTGRYSAGVRGVTVP